MRMAAEMVPNTLGCSVPTPTRPSLNSDCFSDNTLTIYFIFLETQTWKHFRFKPCPCVVAGCCDCSAVGTTRAVLQSICEPGAEPRVT